MTSHDFDTSFREFLTTAWPSATTRARRQMWLDVRDEARGRWARVLSLRARGLPYSNAVLDGLLPYADTPANRAHDRWLHPSSTLTSEASVWFERDGRTLSADWPVAADATVQFIERCLLCPERLQEVCERFMEHPQVRGFQSSLLSPLLNALVPERFRVVNAASLATLRAFTGVPWSPRLVTYPKANEALAAFTLEHAATLDAVSAERHHPADVLDLFARWFVARAPGVIEEPWERPQTAPPPAVIPGHEREVSGVARSVSPLMERASMMVATTTLPFGDEAARYPRGDHTLARCAVETGFGVDELRRWVDAIRRKGQAMVSGPTGTGKTFLARHLAGHLAGENGLVEQLQLHAGYRYEDFVETTSPGARTPGRLLEFLSRARGRSAPSVLLLDDAHRADLARVMGEAMHAIEYRAQAVRLASGAELTIPRDVYVIGTMNASDRSITVADQSLRRRFAFIALPPRYDVLERFLAARGFDAVGLVATLRAMNQALGVDAPIGTSPFFRVDLADVIDDVWVHEVEAHLEHHLAHNPRIVDAFRWTRVRDVVTAPPSAPPASAPPVSAREA